MLDNFNRLALTLSGSGFFYRGINVIKKHDLIFLFLLTTTLYHVNFRSFAGGDTLPAALLPFSILDQHTLYLDQFSLFIHTIENPYMFSVQRGHYVSSFPIVLPVLVTPLYVIPYLFLNFFHIPVDMLNPSFKIICIIMNKIAASFIAALSAIFLYMSLKNLFSQKISLFCTLIFAFATSTWAISSQNLWQHGAVELFLAVLIYLVVMNENQENQNNFFLMGLLSGLLIFCRPPDSILLIPILYYVLVHTKIEKIYFLSALILVSLPFAAYNFYFFNNLFGGYISNISLFSFNLDAITRFFGLLISPNRGLLIFSPVCLIAIFGIFGIKEIKSKNMHCFFIVMAISVLCQIIVYSFFTVWWGGHSYGPRFLTGMLPFFMIFLAVYFDKFTKTTWNEKRIRKYFILFAIIILIFWSVFVQIVGAFYSPNGSWNTSPDIDENTHRLWDWNDLQILHSFWAGPSNNGIVVFKKILTDNFLQIR